MAPFWGYYIGSMAQQKITCKLTILTLDIYERLVISTTTELFSGMTNAYKDYTADMQGF